MVFADRSLAQDTVDFLLWFSKRHLFGICRYVLDSDFHRTRDALDGIVEQELSHFERDLKIHPGWRNRAFPVASTKLRQRGLFCDGHRAFHFSRQVSLGTATAAHQVEGNNLNCDYWVLEHTPGSPFVEPSGDSCDQYHLYADDIAMLAHSASTPIASPSNGLESSPSPASSRAPHSIITGACSPVATNTRSRRS